MGMTHADFWMQRGDVPVLNEPSLAAKHDFFIVQLDQSGLHGLVIRDDGWEAAEQLARVLLEGVRRKREALAAARAEVTA